MLCEQKTSDVQRRKIQVYQETMRSIWQREQIYYCDSPECDLSEAGYRLGKRLLASKAEFTGLIAANDLLAIGALGAMKEMGMRVPEQVSIVGYDGINASALPLIGLTTMALPRIKMAEKIIDILRRHAMNPESAPEHYLVKPELIIRSSTSLR